MIDTIAITGWHSGTNPSPGLGVAKSIIDAWSDAKIIAIDYSSRSTGLSDPVASERLIMPGWDESDPEAATRELVSFVERRNAVLVSCLDLEIDLLASMGLSVDRFVLVPPKEALAATLKPARAAARMLGIETPASIECTSLHSAVDFAAMHGWPVVVKGRHYESMIAAYPAELRLAAEYVRGTWNETPLVQEMIEGVEHSIAFCAYRGELIEACSMEKTESTLEGKTWCGRVEALTPSMRVTVENMVASLHWSGGGEIEMIRSSENGKDYLIDFNPRFPAWIYGATLRGFNLPAALVSAATGRSCVTREPSPGEFIREVVELRSKTTSTASPARRAQTRRCVKGKGHPSGMPDLAALLNGQGRLRNQLPVPATCEETVAVLTENECEPPDDQVRRLFLPNGLSQRLERMERLRNRLKNEVGTEVSIAYSLKTNPDPRVLEAVRRFGFDVEAISLMELSAAQRAGFARGSCTLNGPGKWWPESLLAACEQPARVNCDSVEDVYRTLDLLEERGWDETAIGMRFAPLQTFSRFGIDLRDPSQFVKYCRALRDLPESRKTGIHFHFAQSTLGCERWACEVENAATFALRACEATGRALSYFDLGGGWRLDDFDQYADAVSRLLHNLKGVLPDIERYILEPGKLIVEDSFVLACRVLEVRKRGDAIDLIVSAALSDMPDAASFPHEVFWKPASGASWSVLGEGHDRISGRICMEADVLREGVGVPSSVQRGDSIAFGGVGAYDTSMSYDFGKGSHRE